MPFWELTLHLILSNRLFLPRFSGYNSIGDTGATALGAGLKGSSLQELHLGECVVLLFGAPLPPAVTNDAILGTDVAPYPLEPFTSVAIFRRELRRRRRSVRVGGGPEGIGPRAPVAG